MFLRQGDTYFMKLELLDSFESQVGGGRRPEGRTVQGGNYHVNTNIFGIFCYLQYQNIDQLYQFKIKEMNIGRFSVKLLTSMGAMEEDSENYYLIIFSSEN